MESSQDISEESVKFKSIKEYKDNIKKQAEDLVCNKFPKRVLELEIFLKNINFKRNDAFSTPDELTTNSNDGTAFKKRKLDVNSSNDCEEVTPCNKDVTDVVELAKPHISQLLEDIQLLKMWIKFLTPRSEDGASSILSVLCEILTQIQESEFIAKDFFEDISDYYKSRAEVIGKVCKYPHIDDYRKTVEEMDEKFHRQVRQTINEIKNDYLTLHDKILKNLKQIKKLRKFNPSLLY